MLESDLLTFCVRTVHRYLASYVKLGIYPMRHDTTLVSMGTERTDSRLAALGQTIRQHREAQHLSQDRLAKMINTNQAYICRVENAQVNPGITTIFEIADALDVPVYDLMEF